MNKKHFINAFIILVICSYDLFALPNCNVYKEDENCYEACLEAEKAAYHLQGSKGSQAHFLKSMELCPEFSYSHFEHSVPFAKRGQMNSWIKKIDKAVELSPTEYLGQRGWYHWLFMHNYDKAIEDIDKLDALLDGDIGETGDGEYHLNVMKALCYKGLGNFEKAIELIETHMATEDYYQKAYDRLHLGVLYIEVGKYEEALAEFEKHLQYNPVSETHYYAAQAHKLMNNEQLATKELNIALEMYDKGQAMSNPYRQLIDEVYRLDIEEALAKLN